MPIDWIERTFQPVLTTPVDQLRLFPVWLLLGPRQVGKSSLLHKCACGDEEKRLPRALSLDDYFQRLLETGFPRLHGIEDRATRDLYLSSYMQTYIERDIRELLRIEKRREFETFVKLCALRTGQIVNYHDLARDASVSPATVKDWLSVLEDGFLIRLLPPYFTNRTRRMTKSPKLYFLDAGLAAWLGGWRNAQETRLGPMGGSLFETHVLADVLKRFRHRAREVQVHFWRTRDGQEIDFLVENDGKTFPVEAKLGSPRYARLPALKRIAEPNRQGGQIVSLVGEAEPVRLDDDWSLCSPGALNVGAVSPPPPAPNPSSADRAAAPPS